MAEKKQNIKNGQDITIDDVTVLNGVSVSEKAEEKEETKEVSTEGVTSEEVKEETNETEVPSEETAVAEEETKEDPFASIDGSMNSTYGPQPFSGSFDIPTFESYTTAPVDTNNNFEKTSTDTKLPEGVKKALGIVQNEVIEVIKKDENLEIENTNLKNENNDFRKENLELKSQIQILENELANVKNSMANVQSRILDVFGASQYMRYNNIASTVEQSVPQQESNIIQFPQQNFNDEQVQTADKEKLDWTA